MVWSRDRRNEHTIRSYHLVCSIPPKLAVSNFMGILKGKTAIKIFEKKRYLKMKPYKENHF
jgi:putative transposase